MKIAKQILSLSALISSGVSYCIAIIALTMKIPREGKIAAWIKVVSNPRIPRAWGAE